jgi:hypothetical protein
MTQDRITNTNNKKRKTSRNQQNMEKARKVPKVGKMAAGPVQAGYDRGRGIGSSIRWGRVKRPSNGQQISDTDQRQSQAKSRGGGV